MYISFDLHRSYISVNCTVFSNTLDAFYLYSISQCSNYNSSMFLSQRALAVVSLLHWLQYIESSAFPNKNNISLFSVIYNNSFSSLGFRWSQNRSLDSNQQEVAYFREKMHNVLINLKTSKWLQMNRTNVLSYFANLKIYQFVF